MLPAHFHDVSYDFGEKYCRRAQRAQQQIQDGNLRTLKSKSYEHCRTKHKYYNNKAPHFLTPGLQIFRSDKSFDHVQNHTSFHEFY